MYMYINISLYKFVYELFVYICVYIIIDYVWVVHMIYNISYVVYIERDVKKLLQSLNEELKHPYCLNA